MQTRRLTPALLVILAALSAPAHAATGYTQEVHLRDGRTATCHVNEDTAPNSAQASSLSVAEQTEAQIDATAPLRSMPPPRDTYPNPSDAPQVDCF